VKKLYEKGLKALFKLYKLTEQNYNIQTLIYVFDHTIAPILLYGSEVWGIDFAKLGKDKLNTDFYFEKHLDDSILTQLEMKFYKRLLHVKRHTSNLAVRGELGRHPITLKAVSQSIKYFNHILQRPETKLVKQALNESKNLDLEGKKTWYTKLRQTLQTFNIPPNPVTSSKHQQKTLDKRTHRMLELGYEKYWCNQINSTLGRAKNKGGNKLRTYCKLKQNFSMEKYIMLIEDTTHRTALAQLRLSSHPLHVETLRGTVTDPNDRVCQMCTLNITEDEFHLVAECPAYKTLRENLELKLSKTPNVINLARDNKAIWLLTNEDKNICKALGKFIHECIQFRKQKLNTLA
jgi:hypothetical protein